MSNLRKPPAHPLAALLSIGGMSLAVAATLQALGLTRGIDTAMGRYLESARMGGEFRDLPVAWTWLWTIAVSCFGLAAAVINSRHPWRRSVIWISVLVLTACWAPALGLSGWKTPIAVPLVAALWCGLWAMIYAARHQEPEA